MGGPFTTVTVHSFLQRFLPEVLAPLPDDKVLMFPEDALYRDGEQAWVDAINASNFFPNLTFHDTNDSNIVTHGFKRLPDITAFVASELAQMPRPIAKKSFSELFHHAALIIERRRADEDPFLPVPTDEAAGEKSNRLAKHVQAQLVAYAMDLHIRRPRVFSFQLLLVGQNARMLQWDRSGAIVSDLFDWTQGPTLYQFLSRFHAADGLRRGLDMTAHAAQEDEIIAARTAFELAGFGDSPATQAPFYVYEVSSPAENALTQHAQSFIAGRPVTRQHAFTGRACTGYICYEKETGGVHFMKDGWRLLGQDALMPETDVYRILNKVGPVRPSHPDDGEEDYFMDEDRKEWLDRLGLGPVASDTPSSGTVMTEAAVPHVATMLCGGDVSDENGPQQTFDHHMLRLDKALVPDTSPLPSPQDGARPRPMEHYVHFRLVLREVGQSLSKFETVRDLLQVILDVVEAHSHARRRGVLHRDISANNVLIVKDQGSARGLLIDWDLALMADKAGSQEPRQITGTWRFMSSALREARKGHIHTTKDDLESIFWLLLYMLGRYTDLIEGPADRVADIMTGCFDRAVVGTVQQPGRPVQMVDGRSKTQTLRDVAAVKGHFCPPQTHLPLQFLLDMFAGSLQFFLQAREATCTIRMLSPQASEMHPGHQAELDGPHVLSWYRQADLDRANRQYDNLKAFQNQWQVFRYQTVIKALKSARDDFDTVIAELRKDPDLYPGGVIRGATVTGDRYP